MSSENTTVSKEALTTLKNYRLLGQSGLRVSPMGLGCMTFGKHAFGYEIGADYDESKRVAEKYLEAGGNFFDTANTYNDGESEKFLGEILKGRRDEAVIATKYTNSIRMGDPNAGGNSRKSMFQTIDRSLKSLQTDYLDLLYIHYWDYTTPAEEILRSFDDLVRSGKVHYIAVSDLPAWKIAQMNTISSLRGWPQFIGIQLEYSLLARTVEHELIPMARELGLGVIPWGPLASGLLTGKHSNPQTAESTAGRAMVAKARLNDRNQRIIDEVVDVAKQVGKSPAQVAINWVMQQPGVTSPLLGARTVNQLGDNMSALDFVLPKEHVDRLSAVSAPEPIFPYNHIKGPRFTALSTGGCSIETRYKF